MKAYVVSPGAEGASTGGSYLPFIKQHQIAVMGWAADDSDGEKRIGHKFADMPEGSLVIIASGMNSSKTCVGAGFAGKSDPALARKIGIAQVRHLDSYVSLEDEELPFSAETSKYYGQKGNRFPACYDLDPERYAGDRAVIRKVLTILEKSQGGRMIDEMIKLLEKAKQVVFTGAPGTGKTYLARQIAQKMILGKIVDDESKLTLEEKTMLEEQMGFVQFHPSYDYTDFVEGLRPIKSPNGDTLGFERRDGAFKKFCSRAAQKADSNFDKVYERFISDIDEQYSEDKPLELKTDGHNASFYVYPNSNESLNLLTGPSKKKQGSLTPDKIKTFLTDTPYKWWSGYYRGVLNYLKSKYGLSSRARKTEKPYVFIIDEINRGDISKIFGELFFAMDKGYRGKEASRVKTQYDNLIEKGDVFYGGFYVPDNVYIIGTMNDIDRNVESMDFAIRRRFTWKEIEPSVRFDAMWSDLDEIAGKVKEEARRRMNNMNTVIAGTKNGLGPAYQIGPSYFRELATYNDDPDGGFASLWRNHLEPLIREYLRGFPNADGIIEKIYMAYEKPLQAEGDAEEAE